MCHEQPEGPHHEEYRCRPAQAMSSDRRKDHFEMDLQGHHVNKNDSDLILRGIPAIPLKVPNHQDGDDPSVIAHFS